MSWQVVLFENDKKNKYDLHYINIECNFLLCP